MFYYKFGEGGEPRNLPRVSQSTPQCVNTAVHFRKPSRAKTLLAKFYRPHGEMNAPVAVCNRCAMSRYSYVCPIGVVRRRRDLHDVGDRI